MSAAWYINHLGWSIIAALALVAATARRHTSHNVAVALALDATPYLPLLSAACLTAAIGIGDWQLAVVSAMFTTHQLSVLEAPPRPRHDVDLGSRAALTLVCANVYTRNRTPDALAEELLRCDPDIIVITEWNPTFAAAFRRQSAGRYPNQVCDPNDESDYAVCILSQLQLQPDSGMIPIGPLSAAQAIVRCAGTDVRIVGVNPTAIVDRGGYQSWKAQMRALRTHIAGLPGRAVVLGDFNTTRHRPEFQALLHAGFVDALQPAGTDRTASFKLAAHGPFSHTRPLVRLDHALINRGLRAADSENLRGDGTDHSPFSLTVHVDDSGPDDRTRLLSVAA